MHFLHWVKFLHIFKRFSRIPTQDQIFHFPTTTFLELQMHLFIIILETGKTELAHKQQIIFFPACNEIWRYDYADPFLYLGMGWAHYRLLP
jgi:hypothetical protein